MEVNEMRVSWNALLYADERPNNRV